MNLEFPLLTDIFGNIDELLYAHSERTPAYVHGERDRFKKLFSIQAAEDFLTKSLVRPESIAVVNNGSGTPTDQLTCSFTLGIGGKSLDFIDASKVSKAFSQGSTVLIRGLDTFWPAMKTFAVQLEEEISHPVSINTYITPPRAAGLARHYDMHEVFILQVEGTKSWQIGPRGFMDPIEGRNPHKHGPPVSEEQTLLLSPGDALYLPRGYLHRCDSGPQTSLHLTVGILTRSRIDILTDFIEEAAKDETFRKGLPLGFLRTEEGKPFVDTSVSEFAEWAKDATDSVIEREKSGIGTVRRVPPANVFIHE